MAIEIVGFESVFEGLDDMNISDKKKRVALKGGCEIVQKSIQDNSYERTGAMKKSWKGTIKRFDGNLGFEIKGDTPQDIENEFGSSTNKKHIGFFSKAVDRVADEVVEVIERGVLE
ncbi:HK97 gp10 family phage protein [Clostridium sp. YIM B02551]|uniref:HK97 gp10 family phage protein n=1 Tax=Clostridium sp. YIM B02551 TaxID=2910679 RepID=UPI001EE9C367|nr:HK97 gp10 family phage protein [Clostridium sp. YIM B02551]